VISPLK